MDKKFELHKKLTGKRITKRVLSEQALYWGYINMPNDWHIDPSELIKNITMSSYYQDVQFKYDKVYERLKTYITDFMRVEHYYDLFPAAQKDNIFGKYYERNEISKLQYHLNDMDLAHACDFVCLYGVEIDEETCEVDIYYDDNRRAGRCWTIPLETNKFLIFPSSLKYQIRNVNNKYLNFVQTILFEYPAAHGGGYNGQ